MSSPQHPLQQKLYCIKTNSNVSTCHSRSRGGNNSRIMNEPQQQCRKQRAGHAHTVGLNIFFLKNAVPSFLVVMALFVAITFVMVQQQQQHQQLSLFTEAYSMAVSLSSLSSSTSLSLSSMAIPISTTTPLTMHSSSCRLTAFKVTTTSRGAIVCRSRMEVRSAFALKESRARATVLKPSTSTTSRAAAVSSLDTDELNDSNNNSNNKEKNQLLLLQKQKQEKEQQEQDQKHQQQQLQQQQRRNELLNRSGPYWKLNKSTGDIEFGATIQLVTKLIQPNNNNDNKNNNNNNNQYSNDNDDTDTTTITETEQWNTIAEWLSCPDNEYGVAASIWDPKMISKLIPSSPSSSSTNNKEDNYKEDNTNTPLYRLQVMKLQFITLSIQPTVDVVMKTEYYNNDRTKPIFVLYSIGFQPNISIIGPIQQMNNNNNNNINMDDIIQLSIEVVGRLVPTKDGTGVTGKITFTTNGILPVTLRFVPESILQNACTIITNTIEQFAIASFTKGSKENFQKFVIQQQQRQQQERKKELK